MVIKSCPFCNKKLLWSPPILYCICSSFFKIVQFLPDLEKNFQNANFSCIRKIDNYGIKYDSINNFICVLEWSFSFDRMMKSFSIVSFFSTYENFLTLDSNKIKTYITFS